jgi:putative hydrolase of the HAD superfamily
VTIKALCFDLWDTLVVDESDEPKRKALGLRTKKAERRHLLWEALSRSAPITASEVTLAFDVCDAAFNKVWHDQHVTWTLRERLAVLQKGLGRTLPDAEIEALCQAYGTMETTHVPDAIAGVHECLATLASRYKLAVISDAVFTPGTSLRRLLSHYDLLRFFSAFVFSDELGHSKPDLRVFARAAAELGVRADEIIHIGDRQHNDIKGAQDAGMKAVLFCAARDIDKTGTTADAVCATHAELPAVIERLAR